jgi:hypothetical protein
VRLKKAAALAGLLLVSTMLGLVLAEGLARVLSPFPEKYDMLWMLGSPTFQTDHDGAVRYVPNQTVRSVMLQGGDIVYDVRFHTNDLGFIDHEDYSSDGERPADARRLVFVGDSYTAGFHGGTPWVPALRDDARRADPDLEIYNLGVSGSGLEQFFRLVHSASAQLDFSEIVILAISDDFWRIFWTPLATDDAIRFCSEDKPPPVCLATVSPVARIFDPALDQTQLQVLAAQFRRGQQQVPRRLRDRLIDSCRLAALLHQQFRRFKLQLLSSKSLARLADLRKAFPNKTMRFIHLPSMRELSRGGYDLYLEDDITEMGIEYFPAMTACDWPEGMFIPEDRHPNAIGYAAISNCVANHLGLAPQL